MNYQDLETLKKRQVESLQNCEEKLKQWEKFSGDYEDLKNRLQSLPDKVSYDIMVPICGNVALVPGTMIHTNEVMVLLGDDYLVERSAKQAAEIAGRRLQYCNEMKNSLYDEKKQYENWMNFTSGVQDEEGIDIKEEYNEDEERNWKVKHQENVRKHKQVVTPIAEVKESSSMSDAELWTRLNELEIQEQMENADDSDQSNEEYSEDASETSSVTSSSEDDANNEPQKKVAFEDKENNELKTINIYFKHSDCKSAKTPSQNGEICNPSDIYDQHIKNCKLKSVLKKPSSLSDSSALIISEDSAELNERLCHQGRDDCQSASSDQPVFSAQKAFTGTITERKMATVENESKDDVAEKPVSRFKARRLQKT